MITGLLIDISSEELKKILDAKVDYYDKRAIEMATKMKELVEFTESQEGRGKGLSSGAVQGLSTDARSAREKCKYFKFLADHVVPNETYRLGDGDLSRIEIKNDRY